MSNTSSLAFVAISVLSLVNSIGDSYAQELSDTLVSSVGDSHLRELSDEALEAELKRRGVLARDIEGSTSILLQEAGSRNASGVHLAAFMSEADRFCKLHMDKKFLEPDGMVSATKRKSKGPASGKKTLTADSPSDQFQAWPAIFEGVKNLPLAKARAAVVKNKCNQNATSCTWSTVGASQVIQEYGKRIVTIVKKQCTVTSLLIPLVQLHLDIGSQSVFCIRLIFQCRSCSTWCRIISYPAHLKPRSRGNAKHMSLHVGQSISGVELTQTSLHFERQIKPTQPKSSQSRKRPNQKPPLSNSVRVGGTS